MELDLKSLTSNFAYCIEPKPEGGFIARPKDATMEPIEGATREEVQQKIQEKLGEMIAQQLPTTFKFGGINVKVNGKVNVTTRTSSGLSSGPVSAPAPIVPSDSSGTMLRVIAALIALGAAAYWFLHLYR